MTPSSNISTFVALVFISTMATLVVPSSGISLTCEAATTDCTWLGNSYMEGEVFIAAPCVYCECINGSVSCGTEDCPVPDCVDVVQLPGHCCPTCPNGPSCRGPDGRLIHFGQEVAIGDHICVCEPSELFNVYVALCHPTSQ
ncbi:hypothetical protein ACOMHN_060349 [Nucella lapillus]